MSASAVSPDGTRWWLVANDETPAIISTKAPAPGMLRDTILDDVVFLSTNKTAARRWVVDNAGVFSLLTMPASAGRVEFVEFITPAGVVWVVGLNDNGTLYTERFTSGVPKNRVLVTTVMHKGKMVYIADNRFPPPRKT